MPRALINSIPREAKRREADQSSPMHVVLVTILPPWSYLAFQLPKGAAEEPVGVHHVGASGTWLVPLLGHRASHGQKWCLEQA